MSPPDDAELLRRYARERSEEAFAALVERHLDAVYGVALRQARGDTHLAKDITQVAFTALARKAAALTKRAVLGGWLYRTTRFAARDAIRVEVRRRKREQEALRMEECAPTASADVDWEALRVVLDDAMTELRDSERDAVWLRFFQGQTFSEIGEQLRIGESAARMRVNRSLDLLHVALSRRGVTSTTAALAAALTHQPVVAAPIGLGAKIAANAMVAAASSAGAAGALSFLAMSNMKIGVAAVTALVIAGSIGVELRANRLLKADLRAIGPADVVGARKESTLLAAEVAQRAAIDPAVAEIARLQARAATLRARPDGVLDSTLKPASAHQNVGRATPQAAHETLIWALLARDLDALGSFVTFADDSDAARAAFMAQFSEAVRSRYRTPERLCAAALLGTDGQTTGVHADDAFQFLGVDGHVGGDGVRFGQERLRAWSRSAKGEEHERTLRLQSTPAGYALGQIYFKNAPRHSDDATALVQGMIDPVTGNLLPRANRAP
jgi:RNA polymerase sigma factor (sigma-70 family)